MAVLAIVIYVVAALAVVVIGLVTVGRETFAASQVPRPALFELDEAVEFVSNGLDERTASRLTPDDVLWILTIDAARLAVTDGDQSDPGVAVFDDAAAVQAVMVRVVAEHRDVVEERDVEAVIAGRSRYLEAIGAIGTQATDVDDGATPA